ncbi:hypothetical protein NLJ89_g8877 [Agrocybe chaxingu]|uniref:Uncharacterized protein n=1 Tax=Agrocybe chaxingu TaxID=84603 RepID=A0A9W8K116_9AGAR|nr:hypothetical protein NLJ89_g8877 [Agrocybe chaxingu]
MHKELVVSAGFEDVARTVIFTGRPMRVRKTPYVADWEANRQQEIKELTSKGIIPHYNELEKHPEKSVEGRPWLMGSVSAVVNDILPAKTIVDNMVAQAVEVLQSNAAKVKISPKL